MTIKSSGPLSLEGHIVAEFGGNRPHSLSEYRRGGIYVPNITQNNNITSLPNTRISFGNFYGTVKLFVYTIQESVKQINLRSYLLTKGWDGNAPVQLTLASGKYLWSDSVSVPAVTMGSFPSGLTFTVNGFVMGKGGEGGSGREGYQNGQDGGAAISLSSAMALIVNGYIGGGGGGGGSTYIRTESGGIKYGGGGGGGAGGGAGGNGYGIFTDNTVYYTRAGGSGGAIGLAGANGESIGSALGGNGGGAGGAGSIIIQVDKDNDQAAGGGGGGRIFPGVGGVGQQGAGSGGSGYNPGTNGGPSTGGGGGGWGSPGGAGSSGGTGGAGGAAILRNGFSLSLSGNTGNVYGAII